VEEEQSSREGVSKSITLNLVKIGGEWKVSPSLNPPSRT